MLNYRETTFMSLVNDFFYIIKNAQVMSEA